MAAGSAGASFGSTLFAAFGVDSSAVLFIVGLIFAVVFAFGALVLALPIYMVVFSTAIAGATIVIAGVLLVFDRLDRGEIGTLVAWTRIHDNWILWLLWVILAGAGIAAQLSAIRQVTLPEDRWSRVPASA
jgi:hypothetical protein